MPSLHTHRGAKRARETRVELELDDEEPVGCILTALENPLALAVVVTALPEGLEGWCWPGTGQRAIFANGLQPATRLRFTLAHELGHLRCGHDALMLVDTSVTLSDQGEIAFEVEANAFAAEFLAPAAGVRAMVQAEPSLDDVVRIAVRYGISPVAALYRLNTLALSRRPAVLRHELAEGLHHVLRDHLRLEPVDDAVSRLARRDLPRLSPALQGSALGALVEGSASLADVEAAIGCAPGALGAIAAVMGI